MIIAAPTHTKEVLKYLLCDESLREISVMGATISLASQLPATILREAERQCQLWDVELRYVRRKLSATPSMFALRQDSICSGSKVILFTDENVIFKKGASAYFHDSASYLIENRKCGIVLHGAELGGAPFGKRITPFRGRIPRVERGLMWKRDTPESMPYTKKQVKMKGGLEDMILCLNTNAEGKYIAKRFFAPVRHFGARGKRIGPNHESFIHDTLIHEDNAIREATRMIGKQYRFGDPVFNAAWNFPVDPEAQKNMRKYRSK